MCPTNGMEGEGPGWGGGGERILEATKSLLSTRRGAGGGGRGDGGERACHLTKLGEGSEGEVRALPL